jgi:L-idonate 5-dehydrogenase
MIREPLTLGHEVAREIVDPGRNATKFRVGQRVAVNPTRPCFKCDYCLAGKSHLCLNVLFYGSAARFPHVQGAFSERFVAVEQQCFPIPEPMLSEAFSFPEVTTAFELASNRQKAMKVSLVA